MKNRVLYIECRGLLPHIYDLAYGLHFLLLEQHSISVFLRLSVSIKDKWITKTLHVNKKYNSSPSYLLIRTRLSTMRTEMGVTWHTHQKWQLSINTIRYSYMCHVFMPPQYNLVSLSDESSVDGMVGCCMPQEKSFEDKIMGNQHKFSSSYNGL